MKKKLCALILSVLSLSAFAYEGNIDGEFHGWDGETVYRLADGHIIQQKSYHYHYHYAYSPAVIIFKSRSGELKMQVEGDDDEPIAIEVLK
ncbi:hypothetical protein QCE62_05660 [Caballeronia sp. LZ033]|uniref:hypothetical protein n=1 Tax=Caballeronia sp. LZ033 TaxID=3038566 RepID=UPI002858B1A7|nr:hypothetical protein [Caballeronia sp. LZ033]MDR5813076.1 hypothetical protein [Caballeronia sp. LZ033]